MFWSNKATALEGLGRRAEALACFERIVEIEPNHVRAWFQKGSIEVELGRKPHAVRSLSRFLALAVGGSGPDVELARSRLRELRASP
jgi:tetratricopeptide (TPR) repeat protein